jgi:hypothetical protein
MQILLRQETIHEALVYAKLIDLLKRDINRQEIWCQFFFCWKNRDYGSYEQLILLFFLYCQSFFCIEIFHSLEDVAQPWRVYMYRHIE